VLTPIIVDAVDEAYDVVLAHASVTVTPGQETRAGSDQEVSARVELRRPAGMCESPAAQRARRVGEGALSRTSGERELGDEIVDSIEIVAPDHPDVLTAASTISPSLVRPTLRHHADITLKSLASSGPTRIALSFLALFSALMMLSERAGPASLGSGLGVRRLRPLDAAFGAVVARSRIRPIVSWGRTKITTP
jgi:hypothetical protein